MVEKNLRKEKAKRNRVMFEGRLCTLTYRSKKYPDRQETRRNTKILSEQFR